MTTATRNTILLRACPRCRGDLFLNFDEDEYSCLQCGREVPVSRINAVATIDDLLAREMSTNNRRLHAVPTEAKEMTDDAA